MHDITYKSYKVERFFKAGARAGANAGVSELGYLLCECEDLGSDSNSLSKARHGHMCACTQAL